MVGVSPNFNRFILPLFFVLNVTVVSGLIINFTHFLQVHGICTVDCHS